VRRFYVLGHLDEYGDDEAMRLLDTAESELERLIAAIEDKEPRPQMIRRISFESYDPMDALHFTQMVNRVYRLRNRLDQLGFTVIVRGPRVIITDCVPPATSTPSSFH
jgi:hypothetical protein